MGGHYKWIDTIAILWVVLITVLFSLPLFKAGLPWDENFSWSLTNYTILWFVGIGIFFGGWWAHLGAEVVQGPGADGHGGGAREDRDERLVPAPARRRAPGRLGYGMARPLVGITTYVTRAAFGAWDLDAALVPYDYVAAVERAGGRALLVPPDTDGIEETLAALDGLIFSGGSDLDPELYGQDAHPETDGIVAERDSAELALLQAALAQRPAGARDLPGLADAEHRARRRSRPAPPGHGRRRDAQAGAGHVRRASGGRRRGRAALLRCSASASR